MPGLYRSDTATGVAYWYANASYVYANIRRFVSKKGKQQMHKTRTTFGNIGQCCTVLIVLLCPPVAQRLSADEERFIITSFRLLTFCQRVAGMCLGCMYALLKYMAIIANKNKPCICIWLQPCGCNWRLKKENCGCFCSSESFPNCWWMTHM